MEIRDKLNNEDYNTDKGETEEIKSEDITLDINIINSKNILI